MATCLLCGDRPLDAEIWEHACVMHPAEWDDGPQCWPDGEPVLHDLTLEPSDFNE